MKSHAKMLSSFVVVVGMMIAQSTGFLLKTTRINQFGFRSVIRHHPVIFDGCFDKDTTQAMKAALTQDDEENGLAEATRVIDRFDNSVELSEVERALVSFVNELGDDEDPSRFIEYWWRDEWLDFEAHRDVSENEAEQSASFEEERILRYPNYAHVLYLAVDPKVRGPTCVYQHEKQSTATRLETSPVVSVVVVPAVRGRVLRFKGDLLHSVPRPGIRYLEGDEEEGEWDEELTGEEEGGDDDDDEEEEEDYIDEEEDFEKLERYVILFNTWDEKPESTDAASSQESDWFTPLSDGGDELKKPDVLPPAQLQTPQLRCRSKHEWVISPVHTLGPTNHGEGAGAEDVSEITSAAILSVPMLGDRFRRGRDANALVLIAPHDADAMETAFVSPYIPYFIPLRDMLHDLSV
eukprot:CAMPEP_0171989234 /NCGR_PEP_ID=MMETSP0993-20121228/276310_1 /TAXON_ID=483369 /ORGANISM="non described non described, Strain CCMP2098" /LENGTH=407 /DNA_ID=CAMNT_0012642221 /DNA_START=78 /DNA_END=1301 /DNA_ORIENTATION=-